MENKIFNSIAHIKDISKQKVTKQRILSVEKIKNPKDGRKTEIDVLPCDVKETKKFCMAMEDKILKLEEAVMSKCCSRDTDDMSQEYELIKKYSIIEYLSYQITDSNNNNKSHSVNNNSTLIGSVTSINKSDIVSHCVCSREPEKKKSNQEVQEKNKKKVIVTRDSTLNWTRWKKIVEKLSSETTADEVEQLVSCKSDCFFVGTNDLSKQINTLDNVRKSTKMLKDYPQILEWFFRI